MNYEAPNMEVIYLGSDMVKTVIEVSAGYGEGEDFPKLNSFSDWTSD